MKEWEREPIKYDNLEELVNSSEPDKIRGKSQILFKKAADYKEACEKLKILKQNGILDFNFESPSEKLNLHAINITWKFSDRDPYATISSDELKIISEILSKVDNLTLDEETSNWMLSSRLYKMTD